MFVKGMDCKIWGCMYVCVCLCEGMDAGLEQRQLCAKVNKSLKSLLTWPMCFSVFCMCVFVHSVTACHTKHCRDQTATLC